jgi:hypothetical protein
VISELQLGVVIAVVGSGGTLLMLGIVALFSAILRRAFPAKR